LTGFYIFNSLLLATVMFALHWHSSLTKAQQTDLFDLLFFGLIFGSGIRIFGYAILDEIVALYLIIAFSSSRYWAIHDLVKDRTSRRNFLLIVIFGIYMCCMTIIGVFYTGSPAILKHLATYGSIPILIVLAFNLTLKDDHFFLNKVRFIIKICQAYFLLYLIQGLLGEVLYGDLGRFYTQTLYWQGSALAIMPAVPLLVLSVISFEKSLINWPDVTITFCLLCIVSFVYDSRLLYLLLIFYSPLLCLGLSRLPALVILFAILSSLGLLTYFGMSDNILFFFKNLIKSMDFITPRPEDVAKNGHVITALKIMFNDFPSYIFGQGLYAHKLIMPEFLQSFYDSHKITVDNLLPWDKKQIKSSTVHSTGISGALLDTGLISVFFFVLFTLTNITQSLFRSWLVFILNCSLSILSFAWMFSNYVFENYLYFYMLLPLGLPLLLHRISLITNTGCSNENINGQSYD